MNDNATAIYVKMTEHDFKQEAIRGPPPNAFTNITVPYGTAE